LLKSGNASNNTFSVEAKNTAKKGSNKPSKFSPLASGLNRRAFLKQSSAAVLVASIAACKPNIDSKQIAPNLEANLKTKAPSPSTSDQQFELNAHQKQTIEQVQLKLFPDDGDGPSAKQLNALAYLQWALTDPDNAEDGDGEFVVKGVGWLDGLSQQTKGEQFIKLDTAQQDKILKQISQSSAGENWLSLLIYYLIEALTLDPIYGGNPDQIGWQWLKHQPGFPRPTEATIYRNFY
jgi:gluconate 2-dehydrogenase gamma chain